MKQGIIASLEPHNDDFSLAAGPGDKSGLLSCAGSHIINLDSSYMYTSLTDEIAHNLFTFHSSLKMQTEDFGSSSFFFCTTHSISRRTGGACKPHQVQVQLSIIPHVPNACTVQAADIARVPPLDNEAGTLRQATTQVAATWVSDLHTHFRDHSKTLGSSCPNASSKSTT